MGRDRDGGSQRSPFHVAFATTDKLAYHHGCFVCIGGERELFAGCRVYTSRVRAGIASILPTVYHCTAVHAYKRCCCLRRMHACDHCNAGKAGLCRAQFQRQLHVGDRPSLSLGCGEGNRAGEQFLQRRCAISEQSRAEMVA